MDAIDVGIGAGFFVVLGSVGVAAWGARTVARDEQAAREVEVRRSLREHSERIAPVAPLDERRDDASEYAYLRGFDAGTAGRGRADNPYFDEDLRTLWEAGQRQALRLQRGL